MQELKNVFKAKKSLYITFIISLLYVLPLLLANYDYLDDYGRNLHGYGWQHDGRFVATLLGKIWSLNGANFSIYPYSLILSALILGFTGYLITYFFDLEKDKLIKWSSLLILTMPTFLGNLVFKFDCLPMSVALFVVVFPFLYFNHTYKFIILSIIGIFLSLGLYQSAATCYFMVGSMFLIKSLLELNFRLFFSRTIIYVGSFLIAFLGYISVVKFANLPLSNRTETIIFQSNFTELFNKNNEMFSERIESVLNSGNYRYILYFFIIVSILGIVTYTYINYKNVFKLLILPLVALIVVVNYYIISSVNIILKDTNWDFRTFCGLGFMLFILAYFQKYLKGYLIYLSRLSTFLMVYFSFVLIAQFGRMLTNHNEFQHAIVNQLQLHLKDNSINKLALFGTLKTAPKNGFVYYKFPLFYNILGSQIGQYSHWSKAALNVNGMLKNIEIIDSNELKCTGVIVERTNFYNIRRVNNEILLIDFDKIKCEN